MKAEDRHFILKALASRECYCGNPKRPRMSFCYSCYKSLPPHMQRDLYQRMGCGYEEAYDEAVGWLEEQ